MRLSLKQFIVFFTIVVLFIPNIANAQFGPDLGGCSDFTEGTTVGVGTAFGTLSISAVVGSLTSGVTTTVLVVTIQQRNKANAVQFIRQNRVALAYGITLGAGATLADFSRFAGVDAQDTTLFLKLIRAHRKVLIPMLTDASFDERFMSYLFILARKFYEDPDTLQAA